MQKSVGRSRKIFLILVTFLVVLIGASIWNLNRQITLAYQGAGKEYLAEYRKYLPIYEEDQKWAKTKYPYLLFSEYKSDAGPWLNSRISWEMKGKSPTVEYSIPASVTSQFARLPTEKQGTPEYDRWIDRSLISLKKNSPSTQWMDDLSRFDHWDLSSTGPQAEYLQKKGLSPFRIPIPNYSSLQAWAKLRLIRGIQENNLPEAIKTVHHFTRLILSNENLVASMVAVSILNIETTFRRWLESQKKSFHLDDMPDTLASENDSLRLRRLLWAAPTMTSVFAPLSSISDIAESTTTDIGICAGIVENGNLVNFLRNDHGAAISEFYSVFDSLINHNASCKLSGLRKTWNNPDYFQSKDSEVVLREPDQKSDWRIMIIQRLPFIGKMRSKMLLTIAVPNFWKGYQGEQ